MIQSVNILFTKEAASEFCSTVMPYHQRICKPQYNDTYLSDNYRKTKKDQSFVMLLVLVDKMFHN